MVKKTNIHLQNENYPLLTEQYFYLMKAKNLVTFLILLFAYTNANAWNVFVKSSSGYQLKDSCIMHLSMADIAKQLGYNPYCFYFYMNPYKNNQQDIECVLFKNFTDEIICVLTENHVKELYDRDVNAYLKYYSFDKQFNTVVVQYDLDRGIEQKTLTFPFIAETMGLNCDTTQTNGMFVSEKFKYNQYFENGILIKYESTDGCNKWARLEKDTNPKDFENMLLYAKQYWKDDKKGALDEVNAQCKARYERPHPDDWEDNLSNFYDDDYYVFNYKMFNVLYNNDKVSLREFKDFNHGNVSFVEEKDISQNGKNVKVYVYNSKNGTFSFDKEGILIECHPL